MQDLSALQSQLQANFNELKSQALHLDLTRGKPSTQQLELSDALDGILANNYMLDGTDTRNYGGIDGLPALKHVFADILNTRSEHVLVAGNSSLTLMHQSLMFAHFLGLFKGQMPWAQQDTPIKFLCPVPGYDRHFKICESLGIEMIAINMLNDGPDMDTVEKLVKHDSAIKGIWNVPRFSNPTGITYSDATVKRIAELPNIAAKDFIIMWDNAYALHAFDDKAKVLDSISAYAKTAGTYNHVIEFASTSKITFAGSGVAAMASGIETLTQFKQHLSVSTIGPDKINQLRHLTFFKNAQGLRSHMQSHAGVIKPRFDAVLHALEDAFNQADGIDYGDWTQPEGGYFISFNTNAGLAQEVVSLANELGVKLTPAGATFPYGQDPNNSNIRIAPSFASLNDIVKAMQVFVCCVKLATVNALNSC